MVRLEFKRSYYDKRRLYLAMLPIDSHRMLLAMLAIGSKQSVPSSYSGYHSSRTINTTLLDMCLLVKKQVAV